MEVLKVKLKQHTPLIHFQHNERGATLRASEVKPKLDRFILTKIGEGDYKKGCSIVNKEWLVKNGANNCLALDYKISIIPTGGRFEYLIASYLGKKSQEKLDDKKITYIPATPYFAQEKENNTVVRGGIREWQSIPKKGVLFEGAEVTIIGKKDILEILAENIQAFFLVENFGTRQNKGFGCFTVSAIKCSFNTYGIVKSEKLLNEHFMFCYKSKKKYDNSDFISVFKEISNNYKAIKSGIAIQNKKSLLMQYFYNDGHTRWEKKYFKMKTDKKFCNGENKPYRLKNKHKLLSYDDNGEFRFVRALLGLPNQYEFLLENPPQGDNNKLKISVVSENDVERFKSPITYKFIDGHIYLVGNSISDRIFNEQFSFTVSIDKEDLVKNVKIGTLRTPDKFDLKHFMDYAMRNNSNYTKL